MNLRNMLSDLPDASRPVRITLTARQTGVSAPFGVGGESSLFGARPPAVPPRPEPGPVTPENAPEALDYAVDDIIDRDSDGYGFQDDGEESGGDGEYSPDDGPADIWEMLENVIRSLGEPEEDDSIVVRTLGRMEKRKLPGGFVELSIRYDEENPDDPTDTAETVVTLSSREPGLVTISRHGAVTSMIVCEEGVRHVTAYSTPYGTLELAVLAKRVGSSVTYAHGGIVFADYLVEFHGADLQYSQLRVEVEPLS